MMTNLHHTFTNKWQTVYHTFTTDYKLCITPLLTDDKLWCIVPIPTDCKPCITPLPKLWQIPAYTFTNDNKQYHILTSRTNSVGQTCASNVDLVLDNYVVQKLASTNQCQNFLIPVWKGWCTECPWHNLRVWSVSVLTSPMLLEESESLSLNVISLSQPSSNASESSPNSDSWASASSSWHTLSVSAFLVNFRLIWSMTWPWSPFSVIIKTKEKIQLSIMGAGVFKRTAQLVRLWMNA